MSNNRPVALGDSGDKAMRKVPSVIIAAQRGKAVEGRDGDCKKLLAGDGRNKLKASCCLQGGIAHGTKLPSARQ